MNAELTLQQLHRTLLDALFASTTCSAASCYAGWLKAERYAPGAQRVDGELQALPERELSDLLCHEANGQQLWRSSPACLIYKQSVSTEDRCGRQSPALDQIFVAHLFHEGRCHGVVSVSYDLDDPLVQACPDRLLQIAPVLSALIALHDAWRQLEVDAVADPAATSGIASVQCEFGFELDTPIDDELDHDGAPITNVQALSKREQQTAALLVAGYAVVNTAAILEISEHTVRTYIRRLYRKLGVTNRADLVRRYVGLADDLVA